MAQTAHKFEKFSSLFARSPHMSEEKKKETELRPANDVELYKLVQTFGGKYKGERLNKK